MDLLFIEKLALSCQSLLVKAIFSVRNGEGITVYDVLMDSHSMDVVLVYCTVAAMVRGNVFSVIS